MLSRWNDYDRNFTLFDELRRRMDNLWDDFDVPAVPFIAAPLAPATWPKVDLFDAGENLVLLADIPGLTEKDVTVTIHEDTLSIAGKRLPKAPEGYKAHRQERASLEFARTFRLPVEVDAEKSNADVKDGVLTVTLAKIPEAKPRQIAVRAK